MGVKFFYQHLFGVAVLWYRLTQWLTRLVFRTSPPLLFSSHEDIAEHLNWGRDYKIDALKGRFDALTHPAVIEHRIGLERKTGDCEDQAVYRLSALLRGSMCTGAWLGFVWYERLDGTTAGHALALWMDRGGKLWWADYGLPKEAGEGVWDWPLHVMAAGYGIRPICAAKVQITSVDKQGGLVFGRTSSHVFPDDMPNVPSAPVW